MGKRKALGKITQVSDSHLVIRDNPITSKWEVDYMSITEISPEETRPNEPLFSLSGRKSSFFFTLQDQLIVFFASHSSSFPVL